MMRQNNQMTRKEMELKRMLYIVATVILILLLTFAASLLISTKNAKAAAYEHTEYTSVRIGEGESLWTIAEAYSGQGDTRSYINELKALNDLHTDNLKAGSYIIVPVSGR